MTFTVTSNFAIFASAALLTIPLYLFFRSSSSASAPPIAPTEEENTEPEPESASESEPKSVMSSENANLEPPKDDAFTLDELKVFDGSGEKVYVAIKGTIFDVSAKKEMYGQGGSYNIFSGKDASRALGMSSLKLEDAVSDYSTLDEKDMKTLNEWYSFFKKRYNIVGKVVGDPNAPPQPTSPEQES